MNPKAVAAALLPPILTAQLRRAKQRLVTAHDGYVYCPSGWPTGDSGGWNLQSVVDASMDGLVALKSTRRTARPWGVEDPDALARPEDYLAQNVRCVFAYSLLAAARRKDSVSVLDWGGGLGQYAILAEEIVPDITCDWTVRDLPVMCQAGSRATPSIRFSSSTEEVLRRQYDLVLASSSLQYDKNWRETLAGLVSATAGHLLVTRLPICHRSPSFVVAQVVPRYKTRYPGWVLNREELVSFAQTFHGVELLREFVVHPGAHVPGAPEPFEQRGYLFKRASEQP